MSFLVSAEYLRAVVAKELRKRKGRRPDDDAPPPAAALALPRPRTLTTLDVRGSAASGWNQERGVPSGWQGVWLLLGPVVSSSGSMAADGAQLPEGHCSSWAQVNRASVPNGFLPAR